MARLWRDQGKRDEARDLLAPVYGWFTEGFASLDLKEAKALLNELAAWSASAPISDWLKKLRPVEQHALQFQSGLENGDVVRQDIWNKPHCPQLASNKEHNMVTKWTKDGKYCWGEPPYTKAEEDEIYGRMENGPVAFTRLTGFAKPPPPPQQAEAAPQATPRRRRAQQKDHGTP
jgi:hypothetical protein